jgi:hypothetical protein
MANVNKSKSEKKTASKSKVVATVETVPVSAVAPVAETVAAVAPVTKKPKKVSKVATEAQVEQVAQASVAVVETAVETAVETVVEPVKTKKSSKKVKTETVAEPEVELVVAEGDVETGPKHRSFKSIYVNAEGTVVHEGRYCGIKPKQAACKALTGIYKSFKTSGKKTTTDIKFGVVETTRGSRHKKYWYNGSRQKLASPVTVVIKKDDKVSNIVYNFNNVIKKIGESECMNLVECVVPEHVDEVAEAAVAVVPEVVAEVAPVAKKSTKKAEKASTKK